MNKKQLFLIFLSAFLFSACTSDNVTDKYSGGEVEVPKGEIAYFPLNGNTSNDVEESDIRLNFYGKGDPVFASGAGIDGSQALKLNGENNYLTISTGVYDTLSVVFWIKMDNEFFREQNAKPVWIDYGMGAVKVSVDGITGSTQLLVTENGSDSQLLPSGKYENICTWDHNAFFYTEIVKNKVTYRVKTKYSTLAEKDYTVSVDRSQSPVNIQSDVLYIGRPSGTGPFTGEFLQGTIDDIHIYNRGLTDAEVNAFAQKKLD